MSALEEWHKFRGDEILRTDYASLVLMCIPVYVSPTNASTVHYASLVLMSIPM
jgi:hypothetical protein